jgi:hypothetical protein
MALKTNKCVHRTTILRLREQIGITVKLKLLLYSIAANQKSLEQKEQFLTIHHKLNGYIKLLHCMSTDEAGFESNIIRKQAKSIISKSSQPC